MERSYRGTVVIPAYNEAAVIGTVLDSVCSCAGADGWEVIVVNDGSSDDTGTIAARHPVRVITHLTNKGYGAALKSGIRAATSDKIIIMDGDGQHSASCIDEALALLDAYPMVIGERDRDSHQVANRQVGKRVIRLIGEFLVEQKLPDYNSGFRGFRKRHIEEMLSIMPNGFSFSTTSTLSFLKHGYDIATLPISVAERVGRKSSVRFFRDGMRTVLLICRIIMLFNPMKIFLPLSVFCGGMGSIWTLWSVVDRWKIPNGGVVSLVFSLLLFSMGLIADQISMLNLRENRHGS